MPSHKKHTKRGEPANHLISFQYRPPQTLLSPALASRAQGGGHRRHVPLDPEKVKTALRILSFHYILYPDVVNAAIQSSVTKVQPEGLGRQNSTGAWCKAPQAPTFGKDVARAIMNMDGAVPWEYVYAVTIRMDGNESSMVAGEGFLCPICLDTPCAPRITPCGHVYCLPCILQFLQLQQEEQHQRTCPMCHSLLLPKHLKRVVVQSISQVTVGSSRRFVLVHRQRSSPLVLADVDVHLCDALLLSDEGGSQTSLIVPRYGDDASSMYSRYSVATDDLHNLHQVLDASSLEERRIHHEASIIHPMRKDEARELQAIQQAELTLSRYHLEFSMLQQGGKPFQTGSMGSPADADVSSPTRFGGNSPPLASSDASQPNDVVDLYVDAEGQHVYLHFVCTRMIHDDCKERGVPMPSSIELKIVDEEVVVQTEQTRTVLKPLSHIPLCGSVRTVFCDMRQVVGPAIIKAFKEVVDRRMSRIAEQQHARDVREEAASSVDDAWERHKEARRQADPNWRDTTPPFGTSVSPTMEAYAQPDDLPVLEALPPASMSYKSASSTEKNSWGGPSDSSLETRQRATKGHNDITDVLTADNLNNVPTASSALRGAWGETERSTTCEPPSAAVRLFSSGQVPSIAARPTWGGKPFVDRSAKGVVYRDPVGSPIPRVDTRPMVDDDDDDPFEELDIAMRQRATGGNAGGFRAKKQKKKVAAAAATPTSSANPVAR